MFEENIMRYLQNNLGDVRDKGRVESITMPLYLSNAYGYREVELFDYSFTLVTVLKNSELTINKIKQRTLKIKEYLGTNKRIVFVFDDISDYLRRRLIDEKIAFIIPGKQIFILELGVVFSERHSSKYSLDHLDSMTKMKPVTQGLLVYLLETENINLTMSEISKDLSVTPMSISRGFQELKSLNIIKLDIDSKFERYSLNGSRREVWEKSLRFMSSPVSKTVFIDKDSLTEEQFNLLLLSGESALAYYSMLSDPNYSIYGIQKKIFNELLKSIRMVPIQEDNSIMVQIFSHVLRSKAGVLSELSTALVLIDETDERVNGEVDKMIKNYFSKEVSNEK